MIFSMLKINVRLGGGGGFFEVYMEQHNMFFSVGGRGKLQKLKKK
jgi:hypothetical protein